MKNKALKIGICLLAIGIVLNLYALSQSKLNINQMTAADWQNTKITNIGEVTEQKIIDSAPYTSIDEVAKIDGIGDVKQAAIEQHFSTTDTCRLDYYFLSLFLSFSFIVIGILLIIYIFVRQRTAETILDSRLKELVKRK